MKNNTLLYAGAAVAALLLLKKNNSGVAGVGAFRYPADEIGARELYLYANNTSDIYFRWLEPIYKNLAKKIQKGTYDHAKAFKAFEPAMMAAAKQYSRDFGYTEFNPATRHMAAAEFVQYIESDWYNWV